MATKVRIGFVGAGFMGQLAHIRSYALLTEECELVALAEPRQRTAELVAARYGIGRVYRDHRELLESERLDGIVNAQAALIDVGEQPPPLAAEEPPLDFSSDDEAFWALSTGVDQFVHPL